MSEEMKNSMDKLFSEGLKSYSEKAPAPSWDALSQQLDRKGKVRRLMVLRYAAAVVAVFLAVFAGTEFWSATTEPDSFVQHDKKVQTITDKEHPVVQSDQQMFAQNPADEDVTLLIDEKKSAEKQIAISKQQKNTFTTAKPENKERAVLFINPLKQFDAALAEARKILNPRYSDEYIHRVLGNDEMMQLADASPQRNTKSESSRWEVSGFYTPLYTYRTTGNQSFNLFKNSYTSDDDGPSSFEEAEITFSTGVTAQYAVNSKWEFESGFQFTRLGQSKSALIYKNYSVSGGSIDLSTSAGTVNGSKLDDQLNAYFATDGENAETGEYIINKEIDTELQQNFDYLEIPFLVKYKFFDEKVDFRLIGGLSTGVLVGNSAYVYLDGDKNDLGETDNIRKLLYSGVIGVGMDVSLTRRIGFRMEPTFKYALHSLNPSEEYEYQPYSLGVYTGIRMNF